MRVFKKLKLKNDPSDEYIGEVILKRNVLIEKIKAKVYVNEHEFLSQPYKPADTVVNSFVFSS